MRTALVASLLAALAGVATARPSRQETEPPSLVAVIAAMAVALGPEGIYLADVRFVEGWQLSNTTHYPPPALVCGETQPVAAVTTIWVNRDLVCLAILTATLLHEVGHHVATARGLASTEETADAISLELLTRLVPALRR